MTNDVADLDVRPGEIDYSIWLCGNTLGVG